MKEVYRAFLILIFVFTTLIGFASGQEIGVSDEDVNIRDYDKNGGVEADRNLSYKDLPNPGEYPETHGGSVKIDQGFIDSLMNRILGKEKIKLNITSVEYSYRSDDSPSVDLSLNITGLSGREDFGPSSFFKKAYISDPSGNQC